MKTKTVYILYENNARAFWEACRGKGHDVGPASPTSSGLWKMEVPVQTDMNYIALEVAKLDKELLCPECGNFTVGKEIALLGKWKHLKCRSFYCTWSKTSRVRSEP